MKKSKKELKEQLQDIFNRIEFIAEKEPQLINYIQRTVEGLHIISEDDIKSENLTKLNLMKCVSELKNRQVHLLLGIMKGLKN